MGQKLDNWHCYSVVILVSTIGRRDKCCINEILKKRGGCDNKRNDNALRKRTKMPRERGENMFLELTRGAHLFHLALGDSRILISACRPCAAARDTGSKWTNRVSNITAAGTELGRPTIRTSLVWVLYGPQCRKGAVAGMEVRVTSNTR